MVVSAGVVQVVDEIGEFNHGLEDFVQRSAVGNAGTNYQIVAITGPQSSGKSTLMNVVVRRMLNCPPG
jgi:ABC-type thiamine transport system ATPase subunit